jgi:hypothetical protein
MDNLGIRSVLDDHNIVVRFHICYFDRTFLYQKNMRSKYVMGLSSSSVCIRIFPCDNFCSTWRPFWIVNSKLLSTILGLFGDHIHARCQRKGPNEQKECFLMLFIFFYEFFLMNSLWKFLLEKLIIEKIM